MKKTLLTLLLAIAFYGCDKPEPIMKLSVAINNKASSEICIIENYNNGEFYACDEYDNHIFYYFEEETLFSNHSDTPNSITVAFLGDENLCYVFDDERSDSEFKDIRLLSSYQYNEQYSMYEYSITEELKDASSPCTEKLPWEEK